MHWPNLPGIANFDLCAPRGPYLCECNCAGLCRRGLGLPECNCVGLCRRGLGLSVGLSGQRSLEGDLLL